MDIRELIIQIENAFNNANSIDEKNDRKTIILYGFTYSIILKYNFKEDIAHHQYELLLVLML